MTMGDGGDSQSDDPAGTERSRRRLLRTLGGVSVFGLAGCQGQTEQSTGTETTEKESPTSAPTSTHRDAPVSTETKTERTTTETETPEPASIAVDAIDINPTPPRQFQRTTLRVTLENTGGQAFEGTVRIGPETDSEANYGSRVALTVPAGETTSHTVETEWAAVGSKTVPISVEDGDGTGLDRNEIVEVRRYPEHRVSVDGTTLTCGDGTAFYTGAAPTYTYDPGAVEPVNIEVSFETLSEIGCTAARVWGYSPRWSSVPSIPEPYTYSDAFFEHFDRVVAAAKKRDIRLFVPLFNGNPTHGPAAHDEFADELGTNIVQFVEWADDAEVHNDFFHSQECREMYKDWVETVLTHENHITGLEYRNDPTIAMWELGNEIQYGPPRVGESIRHWIEDVGTFVKSLDEQTLLTTGSYGHTGRNAYVDEASADPIDVASIHYYPGDMPEDEVIPLIEDTIRTTHEEIEKPLYVGEYNLGTDADATLAERNEFLRRVHDAFDAHDVAATDLWSIVSWGRGDSSGEFKVYAASDEGTVAELQRYLDATLAKSTSECLSNPDQA